MTEKSKKIKVCLVSSLAYPLFNPKSDLTFGGAELQMYLLAKELAKEFDVHFVVGQEKRHPMEKHHDISVWTSHSLTKTWLNYLKGPFTFYRTLIEINPDIVIQSTAAYETALCALYCRRYGKPFVYIITSDMDVTGEFVSHGLRGRAFEYGFRNANVIIAQYKDQMSIARSNGFGKNQRLIVIENGFPMIPAREQSRKYILWVGRADPIKQPEIFLELVRKNPNKCFVMIMPRSGNKRYWNRILVAAKCLTNLQFIEKVPFDEIQRFFNKATILVNTSRIEGSPITFIQAGLAQTPILSFQVNPDHLLTDYGCGLFCQGNIEDLLKNLDRLLSEESLYKTCQNNIVEYVKNHHNILDKVPRWVNLIKDLLGET